MQWNRASCFKFDGKSVETETTAWLEFPNGQKAILEQILVSEEINRKEQVCESHSQRSEHWKFTMWVR